MPPQTRAQYYRETTPPSTQRREFDTPKKGSPAIRHTRKRSQNLGPRFQVSKKQCKDLVNPETNPVRDQQYEAQIAHFDLRNSNTGKLISTDTLRRGLRRYTKNAKRYKQAYVSKELSQANLKTREEYGQKYGDKPIEFWITNIYTDEVHIDPSSQAQGSILREEGIRTNPENIQQRRKKTGVELHIAGWVSWYGKCEKLEFYIDEHIEVIKPKMSRKPQKNDIRD
ncbi:hypothetical protein B0J14DRAFT_583610 [Halenospora varia]|nr:hypothetical protein B0J14DRAFT_583610 [Halenospora varia]